MNIKEMKMSECNSILSAPGLKVFDISAKEAYINAYEISGSSLSNSCFLHRICWNVFFKYRYQVVGDVICLVADENKINQAHIVYPLGQFSNRELRDIIKYWKEIFKTYNKPLRIEFVDEVGLSRLHKCLDDEGFIWHYKKCVECFDYTYDISEYISLSGKKNRGKRHLWNQYLEGVNSYRLERIENKNIDECQQITEIWESQKGLEKKDLINTDHYPLYFFLKHINEIDNNSYILYRNEIAVAFFIASINGERCTFHFAKSDRTCTEANFLLHQLFLNSNCAKEIKVLNFEDDMGDVDIQRYKMHIAQSKLLEKYSVEVEE